MPYALQIKLFTAKLVQAENYIVQSFLYTKRTNETKFDINNIISKLKKESFGREKEKSISKKTLQILVINY